MTDSGSRYPRHVDDSVLKAHCRDGVPLDAAEAAHLEACAECGSLARIYRIIFATPAPSTAPVAAASTIGVVAGAPAATIGAEDAVGGAPEAAPVDPAEPGALADDDIVDDADGATHVESAHADPVVDAHLDHTVDESRVSDADADVTAGDMPVVTDELAPAWIAGEDTHLREAARAAALQDDEPVFAPTWFDTDQPAPVRDAAPADEPADPSRRSDDHAVKPDEDEELLEPATEPTPRAEEPDAAPVEDPVTQATDTPAAAAGAAASSPGVHGAPAADTADQGRRLGPVIAVAVATVGFGAIAYFGVGSLLEALPGGATPSVTAAQTPTVDRTPTASTTATRTPTPTPKPIVDVKGRVTMSGELAATRSDAVLKVTAVLDDVNTLTMHAVDESGAAVPLSVRYGARVARQPLAAHVVSGGGVAVTVSSRTAGEIRRTGKTELLVVTVDRLANYSGTVAHPSAVR